MNPEVSLASPKFSQVPAGQQITSMAKDGAGAGIKTGAGVGAGTLPWKSKEHTLSLLSGKQLFVTVIWWRHLLLLYQWPPVCRGVCYGHGSYMKASGPCPASVAAGMSQTLLVLRTRHCFCPQLKREAQAFLCECVFRDDRQLRPLLTHLRQISATQRCRAD